MPPQLVENIQQKRHVNGDQRADPNKLVMISDSLMNIDPTIAVHESFSTVRSANFAEVLRGVSFTPESESEDESDHE